MSKNKENFIQNTDIQKCQYFLTLILITTGHKSFVDDAICYKYHVPNGTNKLKKDLGSQLNSKNYQYKVDLYLN